MTTASEVRDLLWDAYLEFAKASGPRPREPMPPVIISPEMRRALLMGWDPQTDGYHDPVEATQGSYWWRHVPYVVRRGERP